MKTIKINNVDCTDFFKEKGYSVGEKKVTGSNGGITLNGVTVEDVIRIKDVLKLPIEPLSEHQLSQLMNLLRQNTYVTVYYYSTNYMSYREASFIRSEITNTHMFTGSDGVDYFKENVLVLEEA